LTYALPPGPAPAPQRQTLVGMTLAAMSMLMLTGGMLAVWLLQRTETIDAGESWLPRGVVIPEVPANVILIAFAGVGVFAQWALWSAKRNDRGHTTFALGATALVALLIVNAQAYIYSQVGLGIGDGTYAVMFYAVTGMFMVLMVVGIVFTAVAAFRYAGGRSRDHEILAAHAIYWYTTAVVYAAVWFVVYVTK
jgi:heme/copper-type cytochrome/quinol oxidase subunit 3